MVHSKGVKINVRSVVSNDTIEETNEVKKYFSRYDINYISSIYIPNAPDEICKVPLQIAPESVDEYYSMQDVGRCGACFQVLAIDPSGNIYPCQSLMKNEFIWGMWKTGIGWILLKNIILQTIFYIVQLNRLIYAGIAKLELFVEVGVLQFLIMFIIV